MITEEKQKHIQARDEFRKTRNILLSQKIGIESKLDELKSQMENLENEIEDSRPRLPGASSERICLNCEIYSMKPDGIKARYSCMICGYKEFY